MFEVLLGYITNLSDLINYLIEAIKSIFSFAAEKKDDALSDEEVLKQKSMFD